MTDSDDVWKRCSTCRSPIRFGAKYWICSVSTCNRKRTAYYFCKVSCWDAHVPVARHRRAYAIEKRAPTREEYERKQAEAEAETSKTTRSAKESRTGDVQRPDPGVGDDSMLADVPDDVADQILVVASRVKDYIDERAEMNTSRGALHALSHFIRRECDLAIKEAVRAERKTVMDRDFVPPPPGTKAGDRLIVVSRTKDYIKARGGLNTSNAVVDVLSAHVRGWVNDAIRRARAAERKTVMDRDFE